MAVRPNAENYDSNVKVTTKMAVRPSVGIYSSNCKANVMAVGLSIGVCDGKAPGKTPVGEELECKNPTSVDCSGGSMANIGREATEKYKSGLGYDVAGEGSL